MRMLCLSLSFVPLVLPYKICEEYATVQPSLSFGPWTMSGLCKTDHILLRQALQTDQIINCFFQGLTGNESGAIYCASSRHVAANRSCFVACSSAGYGRAITFSGVLAGYTLASCSISGCSAQKTGNAVDLSLWDVGGARDPSAWVERIAIYACGEGSDSNSWDAIHIADDRNVWPLTHTNFTLCRGKYACVSCVDQKNDKITEDDLVISSHLTVVGNAGSTVLVVLKFGMISGSLIRATLSTML
jgi:hypothetical protein